ncbi:hypothetical protein FRX31_002911, partial [Thalictrum thalictroides]
DIDKVGHPEGYIYEGNLDDEDVTSLDIFLGELDREPKSLHVLELNWCHVQNASPFQGCSNLTHLSLTDVVLTDEVFHEIVANYVSLKKLILHHLYTISKLSIINANLKVLDMRFIVADEIEVIAENLEELTVGVLVFRSHYIKLRTSRLHCYVSGKKADQTYHYAPNLTKSVEILQMCTSLHKGDDEVLSQQSDHSFECPYAYSTFWEGQKLHNSISNHLTELELTGFKGDLTEIYHDQCY